MSKQPATPAQLNAIEAAFDELDLLHVYDLKDWPVLLVDVASQLPETDFLPPPLDGRKPGPRWLMQRLGWLVREEIEMTLSRNYRLSDIKYLAPWWHECLTIALSLAKQDDKRGKKPTLLYLRDREQVAFWCLAELRFYLWSYHTGDHAPPLRGALQALTHYPGSDHWQQSFWRWSPALIQKADAYAEAARACLWLAILEERPLITTIPEAFEMALNAFGLLRSVRVGEADKKLHFSERFFYEDGDFELFCLLNISLERLKTKANRSQSPERLIMPGPNGQRSPDWWVTAFHQKPRKRHNKRGNA